MRNIRNARVFKELNKRFERKKTKENKITIAKCTEIYSEILDEFYSSDDELYKELIDQDREKEELKYDLENAKEYLEAKLKTKISDNDLLRIVRIYIEQYEDEELLKATKREKIEFTKFIEKISRQFNSVKKVNPFITFNDFLGTIGINKERTNLSIDIYLTQMLRELNQFKVVRRSYDKPMMTPKGQVLLPTLRKSRSESHLTTRGVHQDQVADLSAEIAEDLGLNVNVARTQGKHHDDGHSNGGHTGERIATIIGMLSNCGYYVHNALSPDMLIQENAVQRVLDVVAEKEGELSKERKKEIEDELWKIFDGAISHNGEGNERIITYNPKKTVEQIREDKNKCYTEKGYDKKIKPGSKEAAIVAMADRICYVRTDILDGVELGILDEFNDDYLKYIGILAAKKDGNKLYDMCTKAFTAEEEIENQMKEYIKIMEKNGIDFEKDSNEKIRTFLLNFDGIDKKDFKEKVERYNKIKSLSKTVLDATKAYGKAYVTSVDIPNRAGTVADMIKDVVTQDLKDYSRNKNYVGISPAVAKAFFGIRTENLNQIVQFTRRKYERELLPEAELKLFKDYRDAIINTGIIEKYIKVLNNEEPVVDKEKEEKFTRYLKKYQILGHITFKGYREEKKRYISPDTEIDTKIKNNDNHRRYVKFERKICHHFMKLYKNTPDRLEEICRNAFYAVSDITKNDVLTAIGKQDFDVDILTDEYKKKIATIKEELEIRYPNGMNDDDIDIYIKELTNKRKNDKENLYASAIALEFVAGMTDSTLLEASRIKRYLSYLQITMGYQRGAKPEAAVGKMGKAWGGDKEKLEILGDILTYKNEEKER